MKVFILMYGIEVERGGITVGMFRRANEFIKKGYDVDLVTLNSDNYKVIKKELVEMGRLSKEINIINIYDDIKEKNTRRKTSKSQLEFYDKETILDEKGYTVQKDEFEEKNYARYFLNGEYKKYKKWNVQGDLNHIDYFSNRHRTCRYEFSSKGYIEKKIYFDINLNKEKQILHYTRDGYCYLSEWVNTEKGKVQQQFLFDRNTNQAFLYNSNKTLHTSWLNEICLRQKDKPYLICDGIGSAEKVMGMRKDAAHSILSIRTNHFAFPHDFGSPIKTKHKPLLDNLKNIEALTVLNKQQKEDIEKQFGDFGNIYVIPNSVNFRREYEKNNKPYLVSVCQRYDPIKQLDHAIRAFDIVVKNFPNAKLDFYGFGPDKKRLKNLVYELGLEENINIKGYITDTDEVYRKSALSLLTSRYEGFSNSLIESMVNQTPVISYDINYNPKNVITDGVDGYLIPKDNIELLADKIISAFNNPQKTTFIGEKARQKIIENYSHDTVIKKWLDLFKTLEENNKG